MQGPPEDENQRLADLEDRSYTPVAVGRAKLTGRVRLRRIAVSYFSSRKEEEV